MAESEWLSKKDLPMPLQGQSSSSTFLHWTFTYSAITVIYSSGCRPSCALMGSTWEFERGGCLCTPELQSRSCSEINSHRHYSEVWYLHSFPAAPQWQKPTNRCLVTGITEDQNVFPVKAFACKKCVDLFSRFFEWTFLSVSYSLPPLINHFIM